MKSAVIGKPFIVLSEVESTNDFALRKIEEGKASEGMAWHARYQSRGKGQRGKSWWADEEENINLSLVLQPPLRPDEIFVLNAVVALGVYDFYKKYTDHRVRIKWSNDIYYKDKKAAGILIENVIRGSYWKYAVVGIGMNLNQTTFDKRLPNPVSLRQITGQCWDAVDMARELCTFIAGRYRRLGRMTSDAIISEYENHLYLLDEKALFIIDEKQEEGVIRGVRHDNGKLLLERKNGEIQAVDFGEIRFVV